MAARRDPGRDPFGAGAGRGRQWGGAGSGAGPAVAQGRTQRGAGARIGPADAMPTLEPGAGTAYDPPMLNTIQTGAGDGAPPLVIAHGLFGSARNWGAIARALGGDRRRVIACDMRNHGDSPWFDTHDYPAMAGDLAELIEADGGPADVLGHSMGGKAAMVLALSHPGLVRRLVIADIAPIPYRHSQSHLIEAMRRVPVDRVESRAEATGAMAVDDPQVAAFLLQSLDMAGRCWRLNLDVLDREMDRIVGWPDVTGQFDGEALFVAGAASDYLPDDARAGIRALFPQARFATVGGAGHWLHAEKPREFAALVRDFLDA